jgi:hypothetical protein
MCYFFVVMGAVMDVHLEHCVVSLFDFYTKQPATASRLSCAHRAVLSVCCVVAGAPAALM